MKICFSLLSFFALCFALPHAVESAPQTPAKPPGKKAKSAPKGTSTSRPPGIRLPPDLPAEVREGYRTTETLLRHLMAKKYGKALKMMNQTIRQILTPKHLERQNKMVTSVIGTYQPNTLRLHSKIARRGQTRYIWHGRFAKEKGTILVLVDSKNHISGFVIQSPSLLRKLRKEQAVPHMGSSTKNRINSQVDLLMRGYNLSNWKIFCQPCTHVMKHMVAPQRFKKLRKGLMQRYGRYISRRLVEVRRLSSMPNALIFRYQAKFHKNKAVRMQIVFHKKGTKYLIASWQLR